MVRVIMGEKGTGKTKKLIELINSAAAEEPGNVVCIEAKSSMIYDLHYHVRLVVAEEYDIGTFEVLKGVISGLYAGNYDISYIFIDNLFKIVKGGDCNQETDNFLHWLDRFSNTHGVKFTVTVSGDPAHATDGMRNYF